MSNLGLERKLGEAGLKLLRTKVGDRYVLEEMRKSGCNVGGEQSGHIILADHATTGDGLVAGLQVLAALVEAKAPASELLRQFEPLPQLLKNVRFNGGARAARDRQRAASASPPPKPSSRAAAAWSSANPGTEPLIRVMAEGDDSGAGRAPGRRHLRGRAGGGVNPFLVFAGLTTMLCTWKTSPREAGRRRVA